MKQRFEVNSKLTSTTGTYCISTPKNADTVEV